MMTCARKHERRILIEDDDTKRPSKIRRHSDSKQAANVLLMLSTAKSGGTLPRFPLPSPDTTLKSKELVERFGALRAPPRLKKKPIVSEDEKEDISRNPQPLKYQVIRFKIYGSENDDDDESRYAIHEVPPIELALAPPPRLPKLAPGIAVVPEDEGQSLSQ